MSKAAKRAPSPLEKALDKALLDELASINTQGLIPGKKDGEQVQGFVWPPKERVGLYDLVLKRVQGTQKLDGPEWGDALKRGTG